MTNPPTNSIFRQQALNNTRPNIEGEIFLSQPVSLRFLAMIAVYGLIFLVWFIGHYSFTSKAHLTGFLLPEAGLLQIVAPRQGTVLRSLVPEGADVETGASLFVLSIERQAESGGSPESKVALNLTTRKAMLANERLQQENLTREQVAGVSNRLQALRAEQTQIKREIETQKNRLKLAEEALTQSKKLQDSGFLSPSATQLKQESVLDQQARLQSLERSQLNLDRDAQVMESERAQLPVRLRTQLATLDRSVNQTDQDVVENDARREQTIAAPQSGTLAALLIQPGQPVKPDSVMATIIPRNTRLIAQLYAPSKAVGFLKPGQPVVMRYQAFAYQKFGLHRGKILAISKAAVAPTSLPFSTGLTEPVYRVDVELPAQTITAYGRQELLQPGMRLEADVLLDSRKLYEWVMDPLYSITGRL